MVLTDLGEMEEQQETQGELGSGSVGRRPQMFSGVTKGSGERCSGEQISKTVRLAVRRSRQWTTMHRGEVTSATVGGSRDEQNQGGGRRRQEGKGAILKVVVSGGSERVGSERERRGPVVLPCCWRFIHHRCRSGLRPSLRRRRWRRQVYLGKL